MSRLLALIPVLLCLAGCGVADTGAAAAAAATTKAEEIRQGRETEARVQHQIDAAYQQAAEQRKAAE